MTIQKNNLHLDNSVDILSQEDENNISPIENYIDIEKFIFEMENNFYSRNNYYEKVNDLLSANGISSLVDLLELGDDDLFFALCNRMNYRKEEERIVPMLVYNELPTVVE